MGAGCSTLGAEGPSDNQAELLMASSNCWGLDLLVIMGLCSCYLSREVFSCCISAVIDGDPTMTLPSA